MPVATAELDWRGRDFRLSFNTYTEVFAFMLRPEVVKEIIGEDVEFSNDALGEFVTSVLQYSIPILKRGLHRHVDTRSIFPPSWRRGWRYVVVDVHVAFLSNGVLQIVCVDIEEAGGALNELLQQHFREAVLIDPYLDRFWW